MPDFWYYQLYLIIYPVYPRSVENLVHLNATMKAAGITIVKCQHNSHSPPVTHFRVEDTVDTSDGAAYSTLKVKTCRIIVHILAPVALPGFFKTLTFKGPVSIFPLAVVGTAEENEKNDLHSNTNVSINTIIVFKILLD